MLILKISQMPPPSKTLKTFFCHSLPKPFFLKYFQENIQFSFHLTIDEKCQNFVHKNYIILMLLVQATGLKSFDLPGTRISELLEKS
jgi:hypothetical protein